LLTKSKTEDYDRGSRDWIVSETEYEYEFDELGNWTYQKFTNFDAATVIEREIKYFN
jgi:hypothetical protein